MTPIQTYSDRYRTADPYASFADRAGRKRTERGVSIVPFASLEGPTLFTIGMNASAGVTVGSLSSIKMFISQSHAEHFEGLADMLRGLESARAKADPYVEIDETIRMLAGQRFEHRPATTLEIAIARPAKKKHSLEEFLEPVLQLEKRGRIDSALDALYDRVDDLLKTEQFESLDGMLRETETGLLSTDILLGLLTATLPARSKLPTRAKFFADAELSIKARGEWEDGLLSGLES